MPNAKHPRYLSAEIQKFKACVGLTAEPGWWFERCEYDWKSWHVAFHELDFEESEYFY